MIEPAHRVYRDRPQVHRSDRGRVESVERPRTRTVIRPRASAPRTQCASYRSPRDEYRQGRPHPRDCPASQTNYNSFRLSHSTHSKIQVGKRDDEPINDPVYTCQQVGQWVASSKSAFPALFRHTALISFVSEGPCLMALSEGPVSIPSQGYVHAWRTSRYRPVIASNFLAYCPLAAIQLQSINMVNL